MAGAIDARAMCVREREKKKERVRMRFCWGGGGWLTIALVVPKVSPVLVLCVRAHIWLK